MTDKFAGVGHDSFGLAVSADLSYNELSGRRYLFTEDVTTCSLPPTTL